MKKILCIEDDPDIGDVIELALGDLYDLRIITTTKEVMETMKVFVPDLILLDNYIGTVEAADVMKEIRTVEQLCTIPFILCSGHVDISSIAADISATAYLEKPFDLAELYASIDRILI